MATTELQKLHNKYVLTFSTSLNFLQLFQPGS